MIPASISADVCVDALQWNDMLPDAESICRRSLEAALRGRLDAAAAVEVSVLLTDDAAMAELNFRYREKTGPTNVLSFPSSDDISAALPEGCPLLLGDIVLAAETVMAESRAGGIAPADHVTHLVVHGALHLLGYDHETDEEATEMETLEIEILASIGVGNPYVEGQPIPA